MEELEQLINSGKNLASETEDRRVRMLRANAQDLPEREASAVSLMAEREIKALKEKTAGLKRPAKEDIARLTALVDVVQALDTSGTDSDGGETADAEETPEAIVPDSIEVPEESDYAKDQRPEMAGAMSMSQAQRFSGSALTGMPRHAVSAPTNGGSTGQFQAFAAADLPDIPMGTRFESPQQMGSSIAHRMRTLQSGQGKSTGGLIVFRRQEDESTRPRLTPDMSPTQVADIFSTVANPSRLTKDVSGAFQNTGFCAPSEIDYSFCDIPPLSGLIDLPTMDINRGGVRVPIMPGLEELWGADFMDCYTEAEIMAREEPKVCYPVPCVEFEEHRLNLCHVCITNSILADYAYPELVNYYINLLMWIFEHRLNANIIASMVEWAGPAITATDGTMGPLNAATATTLGAVERVAEHQRYAYRLADTAIMDVIAPRWLRGVIRSDLAKRNGVDMLSVTNAQIDAYFGVRNIRVQWVYDWQDAYTDGDPAGFGGSTSLTTSGLAWPGTVQLLVYPAGTFVQFREEIIRITGQYDYELLQHNNQLGAFAETAWTVFPRCYGANLIEIPICANGVTGEQAAITCPAV